MKTYEELEELRRRAPASPGGRGRVRLICLRRGAGRHQSVERVDLTLDAGVVGDRWRMADDPERDYQVTMIDARVSEWIAHGHTGPIEAGDNFHVDLDLSERALCIGAQIRLGTACLEVTAEPHLGCKIFRKRFGTGALRWVNHAELRAERLRGVNLRVISPGTVCVGDAIEVLGSR